MSLLGMLRSCLDFSWHQDDSEPSAGRPAHSPDTPAIQLGPQRADRRQPPVLDVGASAPVLRVDLDRGQVPHGRTLHQVVDSRMLIAGKQHAVAI